jgi:hypothetical protein
MTCLNIAFPRFVSLVKPAPLHPAQTQKFHATKPAADGIGGVPENLRHGKLGNLYYELLSELLQSGNKEESGRKRIVIACGGSASKYRRFAPRNDAWGGLPG